MKKSKLELFLEKLNELNDISGFLNVSKCKINNVKGFHWVYRYNEDGRTRNIVNSHLSILKHIVISKNLPWEIIDESQAKKSVNLEESNYHLYDNGFGVLFLDIFYRKYNPFNGFWHYKFNKIDLYDVDLENLKNDVKKNNLPWIILNKKNFLNSIKIDLNFESGIYMVNKIKHEKYQGLFQWCYVYKYNNDYKFSMCQLVRS